MIYRNSDLIQQHHWWPDPNPQAGAIARAFLAGELDLLRYSGSETDVIRDLILFFESAAGLPLVVRRSATGGELLISVEPWNEALLLTGRTAAVLRAYLDQQLVRMNDRFEMTVRGAMRDL